MSKQSGALGSFIRARRDTTTPEDVGLPTGVRRRAPGLRRSELATLAGISVEYLVRIEQGRDHNPSPQVVNAIADALRMTVPEREHLVRLAKVSSGQCVRSSVPGTEVRPGTRALLEQLEPGTAVLMNRLGDVLAHTSGFEALADPTGLLDADRPNLTRFVFTDPRAPEVFPDWDRLADDRVLSLWIGPKADLAAEMVAELSETAGDAFTSRLERHDLPADLDVWRWQHPDVGEIRLECETLELPAADAQQLVVLIPADDESSAALGRLRRRRAGGLRAVN